MYEVVVFLVLLAAAFDCFYFIRACAVYLQCRLLRCLGFSKRSSIYEERRLKSVVLPTDIDALGHMNNSRYLREFDYGRLDWFTATDLYQAARKLQPSRAPVVAAISIRFRKSLLLFQVFDIKTRLMAWDEESLYLEQRIVNGRDFVCAIVLCKSVVPGVNPQDLFNEIEGNRVTSPPMPADLCSWISSNKNSSNRLRQEVN
ncbi:protein THEM6-like [Corticium candelabrum]|uniref:protein THEM6-like n=1 Tax=Corticium candelabrum TaxID=121492 RepID=UPI002E274D03|nr:protein THEM6-like [Corticium candelabrum]